MPRLGKHPFVREPFPIGLKPTDEVLFLPLTKEIFTEYDKFFDRSIQLNSMIWSCSVTGRSNLTFEEAIESEKNAQISLDSFPEYLEKPLLYLVGLTYRGRLDDLVNDIWIFMQGRYFVGEELEVFVNRCRHRARIIQVKCSQTGLQETEEITEMSSEKKNKANFKAVNKNCFLYDVELIPSDSDDDSSDDDNSDLDAFGRFYDILPSAIFRNRSVITKAKLKLFLKHACDVAETHWAVKSTVVREYDLHSLSWFDVFGGPEPQFARSECKRVPGTTPKSEKPKKTDQTVPSEKKKKKKTKKQREAEIRKAEERRKQEEEEERIRKQIEKQKEEIAGLLSQAKRLSIQTTTWEDKLLTPEEIAELRKAIRDSRELERQRNREIKRREREIYNEWKKPRDDLLCDDLKPLPMYKPLILPCNLSPSEWGDCLSVLEFFHSFSGFLNLKETIEGGKVTLSMLLEALTTRSAQGPLTDLFCALLQVRASRGDEEDGDEADLDNKEELAADNCDVENKRYQSLIRDATILHEQVRNTHGVSVRHLPLDGLTLTEMLRLHILTSGYYSGQSVIRFRYTHRGGYRCWDDHGLLFAMTRASFMVKLSKENILNFNPGQRLELIKLLCDQLLSFYGLRERLDEKLDKLRSLKQELRQIKAWDVSQEKDAKDARLLLEYIEDIKEKESNDKSDVQEDEKISLPERPTPSKQTEKLMTLLHNYEEGTGPTSRRNAVFDKIFQRIQTSVAFNELQTQNEIFQVRELQKEHAQSKEAKLIKQIFDLQSKCGMCLLGRDRAFRRYWYSEGFGGILIEEPTDYELSFCQQATPLDKVTLKPDEDDIPLKFVVEQAELEIRQTLIACTGTESTCPVHGEEKSSERASWSTIGDGETLGQLINSLNQRGFRENELTENIKFLKPRLAQTIEKCPVNAEGEIIQEDYEDEEPTDLDMNLADSILDLEEKVYLGGLGSIKVSDRNAWRQGLESDSSFDCQWSEVCVDDEVIYNNDDLSHGLARVSQLAISLLQVAQGINVKFLKLPFAATPTFTDDDEFDGPNIPTPTFVSWQNSLLASTSFSQVALHLSTLEPGVYWKRSKLQARCRMCRKKGASTTMVLCCDCDRAYHIKCLRPALSILPETDWNCADCRMAAKAKAREAKRKAEAELKIEDDDDLYDDEKSASSDGEEGECAECGEDVAGTRWTQCDECRDYYHCKCVKLRGRPKIEWFCTECRPPSASSSQETEEEEMKTVTSSGRIVKKRVLQDEIVEPYGKKRSLKSRGSYSQLSSGRSSPAYENGVDQPRKVGRKRKSAPNSDDSDYDSDAGDNNNVRSVSMGLRGGNKHHFVDQMKICQELIEETMRHDDAFFFLNPVDKKEVLDYYVVIKRPMDLRTILNKVKNLKYDTPSELIADARQMFNNCYTYNIDGSEVFESGKTLEAYMNDKFERLGFKEQYEPKSKKRRS